MAHENVYFPNGNYETKLAGCSKRSSAQSLRMKMRNVELNLKGTTAVVYGLQPPAARLPKLA